MIAGLWRRLAAREGLMVVAVLAALASCKEVRVTSVDVSAVVVDAPVTAMTIGETAQFNARVQDIAGRVLRRPVTWSSDQPAVASVTSAGVVTALSAGTATITATAEGRSDAVTVTVAEDVVATVEIDPPVVSLQVGDTVRLTAIARSADGTVLSPRPVNWTTTDPNVADIAIDGLVTAKSPGFVTITATIEGVRGEASVTVNAALVAVSNVRVEPAAASLVVGDSVKLQAIATSSNGTVIPGRKASWTSNRSAVASVDTAGRVRALDAGTATITATVDGVSGNAAITVTAVPLSTLSVTPTSSTLALGSTIQFQATLRDAGGTIVTNPALRWSSSDAAVASVDTAGLATARGVGIATISVQSAGLTATATVFVVQQPVAGVTISPLAPTLIAGDSVLLTAHPVDANGTPLTNRLISWSTADPAVAIVRPTGPVTQQAWLHGVDGGATYVKVTADTRSDSTVATVTPRANLVVMKTAPASSVKAGDPIPFTLQVSNLGPSTATSVILTDTLPANAVFIDATGGPVQAGNVLTWPAIASLPAGGVQSFTVQVQAPGSGIVTNIGAATMATAESDPTDNRASASVNVSPPDLVVTKTAASPIVNAGDTIVYTIGVSNAGLSPAAAVTVTDTLPPNAKYVDATGTPVASSTTLTWQVASLAVGGSVSYTVRVEAPVSGTVTNVVTAVSTSGEANPADNIAGVTVGVNALADLEVSKSASASAVDAGGTVDYTVKVKNIGLSTAVDVVVSDTLPANATFVSATGGPSLSGRNLVWPATATLPPGDSVVYGVQVTAPVTGSFTNIATAVTATGEASAANNVASATTTVNPANVSIQKTGPAVVAPGDPVNYTIRVTNNGPGRADGVIVTDVLPAGVFVGAGGPPEINGVVTWPTLSLPAGQSQDFILQMTAPATGPMVNVASVVTATADPVPADNTSQFTTIVSLADLSVSKTGPASASAGTIVSYTIDVLNAGPTAAENVILQDSLPAGVTVVGVSITPASQASDVLVWGPATLAAGATLSITVDMQLPNTTTTLENIALISSTSADPDLANNRSVATTVVTAVADLAVTKAATPLVNPGDPIVYTVGVSNLGPSDAAAVVVADTLPAGVTFVSAPGGTFANGVVTWSIPNLATGPGPSFTVNALAPSTAGTYTNIATVAAATTDPVAANNLATAATTVTVANLAVSKSGPTTATAVDTLTYTVTVLNNGPSLASNIVVTDTLPAGATFVSASPVAAQSGNVLSWSVPSLAVAGQSVFTVRMLGPAAAGAVTNAAAALSATSDPDLTDNHATASTTVDPAADLQLVKTAPPQISAGDTIVYTIDVTNLGPSNATGVVVSDAIPAGATFVDATGGMIENPPGGGVLTSPAISLAAGAGASYTVRVVAPAAGIVVNTASVASTTHDPVTTNNSSVANTTVAQANLDLSVSASAAVTAGSDLTYTITVENTGPGNAVGATTQSTVPTGTAFVSATGSITPDPSGVLTWSEPALAPGEVVVYEVTVTTPLSGTVVSSATVVAASGDPDPTNNTGSASTVINPLAADLEIVVSAVSAIAVNDTIEYTIVVTNNGPGTALAAVTTFELPPPSDVTLRTVTGSPIQNGRTLTWPAVQIAPAGSVSYTVKVTGDRAATVTGTGTTGSTISPDPNGANNVSAQQTVIT